MKSPTQPRHLEFDGSYLGSAGTQTMYPACTNAHPGISVCAHHCHKDLEARLLFHSTLQEHIDDYPVENDLRRFNGTTPLFKNLEHYQPNFTHGMVYPLSDKRSALSHQVEHCCIRSPPRNAEHVHRSCQSDHLSKRHHGAVSNPRRPGTQAEVHLMNGGPEPVEKPHRRHLPEERKQVLLLKKMELEIEKERLQQMLDQQEARLLLKQQQLQQSKADYSRFKHQHAIEPNVFTCNDAFMTHGGQTSGGASFRHSPLKPPSEEYPSKTSSSSKEHPRSKEHGSGKKSVGFSANTKHEELCSTPKDMGRSKIGFRKDASTSPTRVSSTKDLVTTATSPLQPNMSRYDVSLLNLLEAMSPPSGERPRPLYQEPFDWSSKKPMLWSQPNTAGQPIASTLWGHNVGDEELEESRILEDIFFI